ncbi:hypothetical protein QUH73_20315 [Labilibaculum sp. K2S]|uniref:hypothetical protein n=1 Tax=Labilibaculum sp. K2S TaxID=3056386 RepID=UPI0025A3BB56|nr:hypothetical protein [Labilibaculum sp. K2S]MDM8162174.1 hypothetical protein [Labilibaculum sp. K2S]
MKNKTLPYLLTTLSLVLLVNTGFSQKKTLLVTPGGKMLGGPGGTFILAGPEPVAPGNQAPVAGSVAVTGTAQVGQLLTVAFNYSDAENDPQGTSLYKWYRADNAAGLNKTAISGATADTYTLDAADQGKYITAGVKPVATTGTSTGTEVLAAYTGQVTGGAFVCGGTITVNHNTTDGVSPVTTTITYNTVQSSLTGGSKCWITQNLGASQQAASPFDISKEAAGWYWLFGYKQGYTGDDGMPVMPAWVSNLQLRTTNWVGSDDPCTLLGDGWRLPTFTEINNFARGYDSWDFSAGDGNTLYDPWFGYQYSPYPIFDSELKLHFAAGYANWDVVRDGTSGNSSTIISSTVLATQTSGGTVNVTYGFLNLDGVPAAKSTTAARDSNLRSVRCLHD